MICLLNKKIYRFKTKIIMKAFNFIITIIISISLNSCNNSKTKDNDSTYLAKDTIELKNGDDKVVKTAYEIEKWNYKGITPTIDKLTFMRMIEKTRVDAINKCKYVLTYEPKSFYIYTENNRIIFEHKFSAKNSMGVPDLLITYSHFDKNGVFIRTDF
jgi:hypothetical protein